MTLSLVSLLLAFFLTASALRRDYSFDGMTYTLFWGFSKWRLIFGDAFFMSAIAYAFFLYDLKLDSSHIFYAGSILLAIRLTFPILLERKNVLSEKTVISSLLLSWMSIVIMASVAQEHLPIIISGIILFSIPLPRVKLPNSYDEDVFTEIVQLYAKDHKAELKYISSMKATKAKKRALSAILITESINRPGLYRSVELVLSKVGVTKTTGLMQMQGRFNTVTDQIDAASTFLDEANDSDFTGYTRHYNGSEYAAFCSEVDSILNSN